MFTIIASALVLISAAARTDVPLASAGAHMEGDKVRIVGTTAPRATVSLYFAKACDDTLGRETTRADRNGRFEFVVTGVLRIVVKIPGYATLRAESGGKQSDCVVAVAPSKAPPASAPERSGEDKPTTDGTCIGVATRCGLLYKGTCFMQNGCYNPMSGSRCDGEAKHCSYFYYGKSACESQQGCTWVPK